MAKNVSSSSKSTKKKATIKKSAAQKAGVKKSTNKTSVKKTTSKKQTAKGNPVQKVAATGPTELDKVLAQIPDDQKAKLEQIKTSLDKFKEKILVRLEGYIMGITLLPPSQEQPQGQEGEDVEGEMQQPKSDIPPKDRINALVLIDDQDSHKLPKHELAEKVQKVVDEVAGGIDKHLVVQALLLTDLWQQCYDAKHDMLQMIAMGASVYDTGMLAAIKISEVHKTMVLKKFEKYIVSYVLAGSLTQGKATPESDIDVFVVIDDTDVKKMTRVELRDKLRAIILGMGAEAGQATGIQNKINIQVYILTDFWESIKDASPTIFTFLRDGVPFYDRGVFMPWKQLLQMGRVKPSPEAIDMFMSSGSQFMERIQAKIRDIVMDDLFWALITPSQAALMMYGIPPTTPKETPIAMRDILVKKEKLLEDKYVKTLEDVLRVRKEFEHGTKKDVTGKEMDDLIKGSNAFLQRLEKLFKEIETRKQEEQVLETYESMVTAMRDSLRLEGFEKVDEKKVQELFDEHVIKKGFLPESAKRKIDEICQGKKDYDAKKLSKQEVITVIKDGREVMNLLIDHIQRKRGIELEKTKLRVKYGEQFAEVLVLGDTIFIITDLESEDRMVTKAKLTKFGKLIDKEDLTLEAFEEVLMSTKIPPKSPMKIALFDELKVLFGQDCEIILS
ncbi:nucleotidyltransferase domain-containing protein [Candidatus Woesearchaeota archaeon]|nr:nucleotidyltransferase domain-containing protein [Candidatus Woesearchaeota archaeon]